MEVDVNVNETVFTTEELLVMDEFQLKDILDKREVKYHQRNGLPALMNLVLESNPEAGDPSKDAKDGGEDFKSPPSSPSPSNDAPVKATQQEEQRVIVKLELVYPKKTGTLKVRNYTDSTGKKRILVDVHGQPRIHVISKNETLDLSNESDRLLYEHLLNHPVYFESDEPLIRLVNTEQRAIKDIDRVELAIDANNIIKALNLEGLRDMSMMLKIAFTKTTTEAVLKSKLYEIATDTPEAVMAVERNPDKDLHTLIHRGINREVIVKQRGAYYFNELLLGNTFEDCVLFFKQNEQVMPQLRRETA